MQLSSVIKTVRIKKIPDCKKVREIRRYFFARSMEGLNLFTQSFLVSNKTHINWLQVFSLGLRLGGFIGPK